MFGYPPKDEDREHFLWYNTACPLKSRSVGRMRLTVGR
jgi:hypothetical protein